MAEQTALRNNGFPYPVYGAPYGVTFPILDADGDLVTGATGLDSERSLNGDTFADCSNEATEIATSSGMYYLLLTAAEMTTDVVTLIVKTTSSGAKTTPIVLYPRKLVSLLTGTSAGGAVGYITLASGAVQFNNQYNGCLCVSTIDSNVESRVLQACTSSNDQCTVTPSWNVAPDADDTYTIYLPEGMQVPTVDMVAINNALTDGSPAVASRPILYLQKFDLHCDLSAEAAFDILNVNANGIGLRVEGTGDDILLSGTGTVVDSGGSPIPVNTTEFAGTAVPNTTGKIHVLDGDGNAIASDVKIDRNMDLAQHMRGFHTHQGNTFYVAPVNGNDSTGDGTRALPYKTMQNAIADLITSGNHDTLIMLADASPGATTHTTASTITCNKRYFSILGPGRDGIVTRTGNGPTFTITADGVEISGFQIGSPGASATSSGFDIIDADFVKIRNCWILDTQGDGANVLRGSNCQIQDNHFDNTGIAASAQAIHVSGAGPGIASDNRIERNHISNTGGTAILIEDGTTNDTVIANNQIHNAGAWGVDIGASSIDAFVHDNVFGNNASGDIQDGGTTSIIRNNYDVVDGVWDELLTGATHNIATSAARRLRALQEFQGYDGGYVWIDTVGGVAGTEAFENGTVNNPVDSLVDALTIATAINSKKLFFLPGSSETLAEDMPSFLLHGQGWSLACDGFDLSNSYVQGAFVAGASTSDTQNSNFNDCLMFMASVGSAVLTDCAIHTVLTATEIGNLTLNNCYDAGGGGVPYIDFAVTGISVQFDRWAGEIEVRSMVATDSVKLVGNGVFTVHAGCTGGTAFLAGDFDVTDNASGAVSITYDDNTTNIAAIKTDTGNLVTRITSTLFTGITSLAEWLGLMAGKQVGNSTARDEIRATGAGSGTFDETTDSEEATVDRGNVAWITGAGGSGSGARTVTVTVDDGATVLENATVRFTEGVNTFTGLTNVSGVIVFSLDDATYAVSITKDGYSFTPTTKIVNGTEADTYSMDVVAITAPPNAATTTGVMLVYDEEGALEEGVTVTVQIIDGPGTDGIGYDSTEWAELSSGAPNLGLVEFAGIILGARYKIWRGTSKPKAEEFTAPTTGTSFDLAEVIGRG